jgi:uncharacterized delta-60 repeat protein
VHDVTVEADGQLLIAGTVFEPEPVPGHPETRPGHAAVLRLNPDGAADTTFDGDGAWVAGQIGAFESTAAASVVALPGGKVLVVGQLGSVYAPGAVEVLRLNPDGSPDATFGAGGLVTALANPGNLGRDSGIVLTDGRIVVAVGGDYFNPDPVRVAVLGPDGDLLTPFVGGGGTFGIGFGLPATDPRIPALTVTPDGRIVVAAGLFTTDPERPGGEESAGVAVLADRPDALPGVPVPDGSVGVPPEPPTPPEPGRPTNPFAGLGVEVRSAVADVNGDGAADTIFVTGPGTPVRFAVVSGTDGATLLVEPTDPFGGGFTGGAFVAAGDLDRDGRSEWAVTPDQGGGPNVVVYSLNRDGALAAPRAFFALGNPGFRGGARVAIGDVNRDGAADLAVGAGFLGGPVVEIHDGNAVAAGDYATLIGSGFYAFGGPDADTLRNGVFLAVGDVDADGFADLVAGGGPGGAPRVLVLSGERLCAGDVAGACAEPLANFYAGDEADRGGARVAAADTDGDNRADIVTGSGSAPDAGARVYLGKDVTPGGESPAFQDLDPAALPGVFVG